MATWLSAYTLHGKTIQVNEAIFTYNINPTWGDLETTTNEKISSLNSNQMNMHNQENNSHYEEYDLQSDLQFAKQSEMKKKINLGFQITAHPFLMENNEYYKLRRILNKEQQAIVKDVAIKKEKTQGTNLPFYYRRNRRR